MNSAVSLAQTPSGTAFTESHATGLRSVADSSLVHPLFPVLLEGCPVAAKAGKTVPLEVVYDDRPLPADFWTAPLMAGLERWAPLMPPLSDRAALGEGNTPLVDVAGLAAWAGCDAPLRIKDESRNPTWSHKDRLNRCTTSAAVASGAPGIIAASSGNHGASAAAYAAAAGLPCIILTSASAPPEMKGLIAAYGAAAVSTPDAQRWPLLNALVEKTGFMAVSNRTPDAHTGHPFGPEGYKAIAFEVVQQLAGQVPELIFVPTGYGELLYGVWKGFLEMKERGVISTLPRMVSCEPAVLGPNARAVRAGLPSIKIDKADGPTKALSIATFVGGLRGVRAVTDSNGLALQVGDEDVAEAQAVMAAHGLWAEFSAAIALAALRQHVRDAGQPDGAVVCISTSGGFKEATPDAPGLPSCDGSLADMERVLKSSYGLAL